MKEKGCRVRLEGVVKRFGEVVAVDQVSLETAPGEFLTLLGPSGSGKTTTLKIIAGLEYPTEGEVYIDGKPVIHKPAYKRDLGMVFQNYALFPHMTIAENIAFPMKMRGLSKDEIARRVSNVLDLVKLAGFQTRYPKQASGGQQQRIALARALVYEPSVLLMDEPLGALDKKLREEMQLEVKQIQERLKITTIYVTHDQSEALTMSDRIALMNNGRIEQLGSPEDLYERPVNKFVADFIGESNFMQGEIVRMEKDICEVRTRGGLKIKVKAKSGIKDSAGVHKLAAYTLGANRIKTFYYITYPLIRPGILAGALFAFLISFDELIVALFICGTRAVTLPKRMFDALMFEISPVLASISTLLVLLSVLALIGMTMLRKRTEGAQIKKKTDEG